MKKAHDLKLFGRTLLFNAHFGCYQMWIEPLDDRLNIWPPERPSRKWMARVGHQHIEGRTALEVLGKITAEVKRIRDGLDELLNEPAGEGERGE